MEDMVTAENIKGRDVFVTGHTGFKGAWLCMMLARLGARVHGYALEPPKQGAYRSAGVSDQMTSSVYADVRELEALKTALTQSKAEVVIHMAAQPLVRPSYGDPVGTYATNVMGSVNLLEACAPYTFRARRRHGDERQMLRKQRMALGLS